MKYEGKSPFFKTIVEACHRTFEATRFFELNFNEKHNVENMVVVVVSPQSSIKQ